MNDRRTRLWAGWRQQYLDSTSSRRDVEPSIFSRILESGLSDDDTLIVRRGERCFALMNLHPYSAGHLMVLPKREVADLSGLLAAESAELWSMVAQAVGLFAVIGLGAAFYGGLIWTLRIEGREELAAVLAKARERLGLAR
mgnify:CR=1 FL=1